MKKGIQTLLVLMAIASAACSQREQLPEGTGLLAVSLSSDIEAIPMVKSAAGAPASTFSLEVTPAEGGQSVLVEDYRTLSAEPLKLVAGKYNVRAFSGTTATAAWVPTYEGTTEVSVKPDRVNTAQITASLATTMVTVEFAPKTADFFSEYKVTVANETSDACVFNTATGTIKDTAYFRATTLDWELRMVNTLGETFRLGPVYIHDVKPREHYHLRFSLEDYVENAGAAVVKIRVDDSLVEKEYQMYLDFNNENQPSLTANFDLTAEIPVPKGSTDSKLVYAGAAYGIKSLVVSHNNADLLAAGVPQAKEIVDATDLSVLTEAGIAVTPVSYGLQAATLDFTTLLSKLPLGTYPLTVTLIDTKDHYVQIPFNFHIVSPVDAEAVSAKPWARFAILRGKWYTDGRPAGMKVQYRKASDTAWTDYDGAITADEAAGTFTTELYGLEASTAYVFRVISDKDRQTREVSFTTAGTQDIPNLNFDDWYKDGNAWYPGKNASSRIWDTANGGTASFGCVPTTPESSDVISGKAARLESTTVTVVVITKFAAGNIYVGDFVKVSGVGAELDWGYPYSARPLALHGYYKYMPKTIDNAEDPFKGKKGEMDNCSIKMYLLDWSAKFRINTSKQIFLQDDDPSIIAMCDFTSNVTNSDYVEFTLPLQYRDNRTPAYVVVVGAASRLGDYFTGGKGSTLLLDEFSLIFDAGELTEAQREETGYRKL